MIPLSQFLATVSVALLAAVTPVHLTSGYQVTDLGTLGGDMSVATAVNDNGEVAGWSETASGHTHAYLWRNGQMVDLPTLDAAPNDDATADDVNNSGDVVGQSQVGQQSHAVLWHDGRITDLGTLGGPYSVAKAINDRGEITGTSWTATGEVHGFYWRDGTMTDLGMASVTEARDINNSGLVVGYSQFGGDLWHAFLWRRGVVTDLDQQGTGNAAVAVNDRDDAVGEMYVAPQMYPRAVQWHDGVPLDLGVLPGGVRSAALAINDRGVVLCVGDREPLGLDQYAFLWQNGVIRDLSPFGISQAVTDLSNRGQISGVVITSDGSRHAALYTPIYGD